MEGELLILSVAVAVLALGASPVGQWLSQYVLACLERDETIADAQSLSERGLWWRGDGR